MRVHFIAVGGSVMHNLAIALKSKGYQVSGSDDEFFEPSKSRLASHGLLPEKEGWNPEVITRDLDAVILGMHARSDNPELQAAVRQGIKVYSFPEYLYEQCRSKTRVVIAGSHGKTTITSMVMHALRSNNWKFDYMVGAQLEGFDTMVGLSEDAEIAVFEGDEYLSSPIDKRSKFLWYKPHIALISGIAWDHINVFPTFEIYKDQFRHFADSVDRNGYLTWFSGDPSLKKMLDGKNRSFTIEPYFEVDSRYAGDVTLVVHKGREYPVPFFGAHNMQNLAGAMNVCRRLGLDDDAFLRSMGSFKGASRRLEAVAGDDSSSVFYDFAHAPSKLKATVEAVKSRYPSRKLVACMELHTFSSLDKNFLPQYHNTMLLADEPIVYFNPGVIEHKGLSPISPVEVAKAFNIPEHSVIVTPEALLERLEKIEFRNTNLLIMTSGSLGGIDIKAWIRKKMDKTKQ